MVRAITPAVMLVAALLPMGASADLYRWVGPEGRVSYGDRPPPGGVPAEARPDLQVEEAASPVSSQPPADAPEGMRERNRARLAALATAHTGIRDATAALRAAEERRERGVEPLPGERLGMAGGGSRLAPAYFERQAKLEEDVRRAQEQLDAALAAKNALR